MAAKNRVKAQSKFFYTCKWTKEVDQTFINYLAWQGECNYTQSNPNRTNFTALVFTQKAVNYGWDWDNGLYFYEGDDLNDLDRDRQEHAAEPSAVGVGGSGDDDDGVVFLGTSDGNEPHDVVDLVSSERED
ncbi:hypothetical protein Salat_0678000 [Sesamum alatum]|uniref:Uncharacterized protein n=1 Tax=Sesamum alatum TaxID=300844 RepID=A0AAE1YS28_9LAMI|nr:hypothetical protein Salat_0678000 [Sesamum alatum]